jgi:carbonic anhydrase/acetyltransferase-like protein (isoleucine patch superfamily)
VLAGDVRIGARSCVLFGAVLTDEGGAVEIGAQCVVMEHAVVRGTQQHTVIVGDHVLLGPHSYVSGATLDDAVFVATGAMVFNGAHMGRASSVALGGAVHIAARLEPEARVPIGWVAIGDPARMYAPDDVEAIRNGLDEVGGFLPFVFGTDPALARPDAMRVAMSRYTNALARHRNDEILE